MTSRNVGSPNNMPLSSWEQTSILPQSRGKRYNGADRARRGASGALWPTIRSSGVEFPAEASLFLAGALARGAEGWGPARRASRELRQDRKVAAATGRFLCGSQPRRSRRLGTRRESVVGAGCTVILPQRAKRAEGRNRRSDSEPVSAKYLDR